VKYRLSTALKLSIPFVALASISVGCASSNNFEVFHFRTTAYPEKEKAVGREERFQKGAIAMKCTPLPQYSENERMYGCPNPPGKDVMMTFTWWGPKVEVKCGYARTAAECTQMADKIYDFTDVDTCPSCPPNPHTHGPVDKYK
jgi:hypothetical protein